MIPKPNFKITITVTQKVAEELGLVFCVCGHPSNNHFSHEKNPCAHCNCKEYNQILCRRLRNGE